MQARWGDTVIADAEESELIKIEGNWYFPPASVDRQFLQESPTPYTCPWKGVCQYYTVVVGDESLPDRAWTYPDPFPGAADRVGKDFAGYVAFWKEIDVVG